MFKNADSVKKTSLNITIANNDIVKNINSNN